MHSEQLHEQRACFDAASVQGILTAIVRCRRSTNGETASDVCAGGHRRAKRLTSSAYPPRLNCTARCSSARSPSSGASRDRRLPPPELDPLAPAMEPRMD